MGNGTGVPVAVGLAVGIAFVFIVIVISLSLPVSDAVRVEDKLVTITGEVVCLPHRQVVDGLSYTVETQECAIGFQGQDGKYYGFNDLFHDEEHNWLFSAQGSKELFDVTGAIIVSPSSNLYSRYDILGVIDVASASTADGSVSIYEVYDRHYEQLSTIVRQIDSQTGAGYSMGIER